MRTAAIPLTLLTVVLTGCTHDLPTALPVGGQPAAARAPANDGVLPLHGTVDAASHTSVYDPETGTFLIHLVGTGTGTHLGRYTLVSDVVIEPATLAGRDRTTLTAANGDVLTTEGTVQGTPSGDGVTLESESSETITGGTGRFAGATGSFILRQVNLAPDRFSSGSFDGIISLRR